MKAPRGSPEIREGLDLEYSNESEIVKGKGFYLSQSDRKLISERIREFYKENTREDFTVPKSTLLNLIDVFREEDDEITRYGGLVRVLQSYIKQRNYAVYGPLVGQIGGESPGIVLGPIKKKGDKAWCEDRIEEMEKGCNYLGEVLVCAENDQDTGGWTNELYITTTIDRYGRYKERREARISGRRGRKRKEVPDFHDGFDAWQFMKDDGDRFLQNLKRSIGVNDCLFVREAHASGFPHVHGIVTLSRGIPYKYEYDRKQRCCIARVDGSKISDPIVQKIVDAWGLGFVDIQPVTKMEDIGKYLMKDMQKTAKHNDRRSALIGKEDMALAFLWYHNMNWNLKSGDVCAAMKTDEQIFLGGVRRKTRFIGSFVNDINYGSLTTSLKEYLTDDDLNSLDKRGVEHQGKLSSVVNWLSGIKEKDPETGRIKKGFRRIQHHQPSRQLCTSILVKEELGHTTNSEREESWLLKSMVREMCFLCNVSEAFLRSKAKAAGEVFKQVERYTGLDPPGWMVNAIMNTIRLRHPYYSESKRDIEMRFGVGIFDVLRMRDDGMEYNEIAEDLGIDTRFVWLLREMVWKARIEPALDNITPKATIRLTEAPEGRTDWVPFTNVKRGSVTESNASLTLNEIQVMEIADTLKKCGTGYAVKGSSIAAYMGGDESTVSVFLDSLVTKGGYLEAVGNGKYLVLKSYDVVYHEEFGGSRE